MGISAQELSKRTGATYRQIDHWCTVGIISSIGNDSPGSGHKRRFDESTTDKVIFLVKISAILNAKGGMLKRFSENYEKGSIDLGGAVYLSWKELDEYSN